MPMPTPEEREREERRRALEREFLGRLERIMNEEVTTRGRKAQLALWLAEEYALRGFLASIAPRNGRYLP